MTNTRDQDLAYLGDQFSKIKIFLERGPVQGQVLVLTLLFVLGYWIHRLLWQQIVRRVPQASLLWQQQKPIRGKYYGLVLLRYLCFPLILVFGIFVALTLWNFQGLLSGLLQYALNLAIAYLGYRSFLALLFLGFAPPKVRQYQFCFFLPIFSLFVLYNLINLVTDPQILLETQLFTLFGSPISLGAILVSSVGLYLWCVVVDIAQFLALSWLTKDENRESSTIQATLILGRYFSIGLGIVFIFGYIGFNPTAFAAITGGLSVGLGFGLKEVFSNFVSGILLLFEGALRPGDLISVDGNTAEVKKLGMRATTVRILLDNSEKIIPNQLFFTDTFTTLTGSDRLVQEVLNVGVSYEANPRQVLEILIQLAKGHEQVLNDPSPSSAITQFADSSVNYRLSFWVKDPTLRGRVKSELSCRLLEYFAENQIEIPYPHLDVKICSPLTPE
jgi:potassium efflux system protein